MAMAMLEVNDIKVYYGMIQAIKGVSFHVDEGEVIALIGANGAGKTTILHTVSGLLTPKEGSITFEGQDLVKIPGHKIVSMGMAHVPEGRRVFAQLSVLQNLMMGAYTGQQYFYIAVLVVSSLLNAIYFFRIIEQMFVQREASLTEVHPHKGKLGLPFSMALPIFVMGIGILVLGFYSVDIVTDIIKLGLPEVFLR